MRLHLLAASFVVAVAACGPGDASSAVGPTVAPSLVSADVPSPASGLTVSDPWAHAAAGGGTSAAYFTLSNLTESPDTLLSATSAAAGTTQIHQTSVDGAGMAAMHPVDRIELPAGGSIQFEPGGYHVMLIDLTADLTAGETVQLDLVFEHAGTVVVKAEIRQG